MPARPGKPTRADVARRLGIHVGTVPRLERAGELHPTKDDRGVHRFDPAEVEALAEKRGAPAGALLARERARRERAKAEARELAEIEAYYDARRKEQRRALEKGLEDWDES